MRIVRWNPQERVDLPDKTAENFLVLGEFRRTIRELIVGLQAGANKRGIIRGFEVDPAAAPNNTVIVRAANVDLTRPSAAILPELLGAVTDAGQLVGGLDSAGAQEGAALQVIDFTALAADTYIMELSFSYGTTAADNRAFWDEASNTEFLASVDTRHEPVWTVTPVTAPSGNPVLNLATVVWDGIGPITGGAPNTITDTRSFLFEGVAPNTFTGATQNATYGTLDFNRATDRTVLGVHVGGVIEAVNALQRQIGGSCREPRKRRR